MSDCKIWEGRITSRGYGAKPTKGKRRDMRAHRAVWIEANGPIPAGMVIRHKCDTPACVNLDHLQIGTQADNVKDMVERKRHIHGERQHSSKLTQSQVVEIRKLYAQGDLTQSQIANRFNVTQSNVHSIVSRETWKLVQ